jgi:hypothetical protein
MADFNRLYAYGEQINTPEGNDYSKWLQPNQKVIEGSPIKVMTNPLLANLVLSLCDDGYHRPAIDVDYPCEIVTTFGRQTLAVDTSVPPWSAYSYRVNRGIITTDLEDFGEVELVPSTTPGHFHVYGDNAMTWNQYHRLLSQLKGKSIIGRRYYDLSIERGFTALRKPGVKKVVDMAQYSSRDFDVVAG